METIAGAVKQYRDPETVTAGEFKTEDDAKKAFLDAFAATDCFTIYPEIDCWYFGGSVFGDRPTGRIDYVLTPKKKLLDAGWRMGIIGVEVKKSGHKAGPLICQMIDYSKAIYRLPEATGGSLVCLTAVFCFPELTGRSYAIESIMAQHRLGYARHGKWHTSLLLGSTNILSFSDERGLICNSVGCGYKNGSR